MQAFIRRLLSFDRLMGPDLVRLAYYFGAAVIAMLAGVNIVLAFVTMAGGNIGGGAQLIATPAVAAVVFIYWRFACELFMLAFLSYDRLGQVRDLMRIAAGQTATPAPDPDHPAF